MATTKKVANVRSSTKKTVLDKSVSSSRTRTSKIGKKTSKNTTKAIKNTMATKKKSSNTLTKKSPVKKVSNIIKPRPILKKKTEIKKRSEVGKNSKKIKYTKALKKNKLPLSTLRTPMSLARLMPTRFPVNIDTFAIQTARVAGLTGVALGAFFTLLYSQYIWNTPIIAESVSGVQMLSQAGGCDSTTMDTSTYDRCLKEKEGSNSTNIVETEPPITFSIDTKVPLSGVVPILIHVDIADKVKVLVFEESYTTPIYLGEASKIDSNIWEYKWDTTKMKDGKKYKVAADVANVYTTGSPYRDSDDSGYLEVSNVTATHVAATSSDVVVANTTPSVEIRLTSKEPVVGNADFKITVAEAEKVTLFANHKTSGSNNRLGDAMYVSDGIWKYRWNTTEYTDGDYVITAKVTNSAGSYSDGKNTVHVENKHDSTEAITNETSVAEETANDSSDTTDTHSAQTSSVEPPDAVLSVRTSGTLSGTVDLRIDIEEAHFVELWVVPSGSKTEKIIALAKRASATSQRWVYQWNTVNIPNGSYTLFARVKNSFGVYKSNVESVRIFNTILEPVHTESQEEELQAIEIAKEIEKELVQEVDTKMDERATSTPTTTLDETDAIFDVYTESIDDELNRLIVAYRSKDADVIKRAEKRIDKLIQEIKGSIVGDARTEEILNRIDERMNKIIADHKVLSVKVETLITERVGESVFKDSDSDGISDYDERTLYNTDPYSADSDNDGFIDGVEVAEGYDPLDSKRETSVVFESPKDKGVVRDDILVVESITALIPENPTDDTDGVLAQAVITGKALPNSFLTLYIYSTPIIVTVKTDSDGSWRYRFDKELENGEHEIYIGVTDNAGKIVAKSAAFSFVKEAQAFTPTDASALSAVSSIETEDSLLSGYMIYLILSISVVSIGLVLILLGLHLDTRQKASAHIITKNNES